MRNIDFKDLDGIISLGINSYKADLKVNKLSFYVELDGRYSTQTSVRLNFIPKHIGYSLFEGRKIKDSNIFKYLQSNSIPNNVEYLRHIVTQYEKDPMYFILCNDKITIYESNIQDHIPIICTYEYLDIITTTIKEYLDDNKE